MRILSALFGGLLATAGLVSGQTTAAQTQNDINTLNYALTLENLENNFYAGGLAAFNVNNFTAAGYDPSVYTYITFIAAHEAAHVSTLNNVIKSLGGTPVAACSSYPFNYTSVASFLATAQVLEGVGVQAYVGAVATLTNPGLQAAAGTIQQIEARHSQYLTTLTNAGVPVTNAPVTDAPASPNTVAQTVAPFITACPSPAFISNITYRASLASNTNVNAAVNLTTSANDLNALNYALTLEWLESSFYNQFVGQPGTNGTFNNASFSAYPAGTFAYFQLIAAHEAAHVAALNATIVSLGGTPVVNCSYNFASVTTVDQFVSLAATLEQTGSSAYTGAINTITNPALQQVAASIATVEARHSAFLNRINFVHNPNQSPAVPSALPNATTANAFEPTLLPSAVIATVGNSFIVPNSCPQNAGLLVAPVVSQPAAYVAGGSSGAAAASSSVASTGSSVTNSTSSSAATGAAGSSSSATGAASSSSGGVIPPVPASGSSSGVAPASASSSSGVAPAPSSSSSSTGGYIPTTSTVTINLANVASNLIGNSSFATYLGGLIATQLGISSSQVSVSQLTAQSIGQKLRLMATSNAQCIATISGSNAAANGQTLASSLNNKSGQLYQGLVAQGATVSSASAVTNNPHSSAASLNVDVMSMLMIAAAAIFVSRKC